MNVLDETLHIHCERFAPPGWNAYVHRWGYAGFHLREEWSRVFARSLGHRSWFLWARRGEVIVGVLPLMHIRGPLFGSFLVSQPYLNTGGVLADAQPIEAALADRALSLADELDVKHLELRHERCLVHASLQTAATQKVHMRLALPGTPELLWDQLKSKVRSQIRKPLGDPRLTVSFGRNQELDDFYRVFCRNMRDLGTPPFGRSLFATMLEQFGDAAEICTVRLDGQSIAAGFLLHGPGVTLIPSASALREFNATSCNMLMYWHCLRRSIEREQTSFDFGRSSPAGGTYRFKQQWGAIEHPAAWQYGVRRGDVRDMRPDSGKYDRVIAIWQRLPVWVTRLVGPAIVRGIP
jgi:serine/alanine adding enzyme